MTAKNLPRTAIEQSTVNGAAILKWLSYFGHLSEGNPMSFGGGGGDQGDVFLVKPFIEWWERRRDRRDVKRTARAQRRAKLAQEKPAN